MNRDQEKGGYKDKDQGQQQQGNPQRPGEGQQGGGRNPDQQQQDPGRRSPQPNETDKDRDAPAK